MDTGDALHWLVAKKVQLNTPDYWDQAQVFRHSGL